MREVYFNEQKITSWLEYVKVKFADENHFTIVEHENHAVIHSKTNKTKIYFNWHDNTFALDDCSYSSDECKGYLNERIYDEIDGEFNQENVEMIDEFLDTPVYSGWISIDYYLFGAYYKSKVYSDKYKVELPKTQFRLVTGLIYFILFPISLPLNFLIEFGIIKGKKEIFVEPIIKE